MIRTHKAEFQTAAHLGKGHPVGVFPDLRQAQALLHLTIPAQDKGLQFD